MATILLAGSASAQGYLRPQGNGYTWVNNPSVHQPILSAQQPSAPPRGDYCYSWELTRLDREAAALGARNAHDAAVMNSWRLGFELANNALEIAGGAFQQHEAARGLGVPTYNNVYYAR